MLCPLRISYLSFGLDTRLHPRSKPEWVIINKATCIWSSAIYKAIYSSLYALWIAKHSLFKCADIGNLTKKRWNASRKNVLEEMAN